MFFITGLPRSRTKWFADYFSGLPDTYCFHEAMNGCYSIQDFKDRMTMPVKHVGNSDSAMMFPRFQRAFPDVPTVVIERDVGEVDQSLRKMFGELYDQGDGRKTLLDQLRMLSEVKGMRIPFDDINERLEEMHRHLRIPFDQEYADRMTQENIQVNELKADIGSYQFWMAA